MRQIKFRVWETMNNKITGWDELQKATISLLNRPDKVVKDEFVVMQFTGRVDKSGREIYECDILKHIPDGYEPHELLEVFWDEELDAFSSRSLDKRHLYQTPIMENDYKVIGNIYENPELLP